MLGEWKWIAFSEEYVVQDDQLMLISVYVSRYSFQDRFL